MFIFNPFRRKKQPEKNVKSSHAGDSQNGKIENQLEITIGGIRVKINRCSTFPPTNELSAIIPRAEIRRRYYSNGRITAEEEIILNSITLVDSPRHSEKTGGPPAGPASNLPGQSSRA
ncbi:hypothetical protein Psfp_00195 [Pelotomaculum sp. FP]|uniref:hypothetical protein n=1 Tax=Pelotomaculum sp. FP TaxID=261474 RepID=UPI001065C07A|nr:hypothetical protein [Pelotomaculum sp. FP]TEB17704.1 hypothetical protein Psfp_00195 [Pelotomaculum sp. FP]